jgi:hypothetical protein
LPIGLTLAAAAVAPMFTARAYRARLDRVLVRAAAGPPTLMLLLAFLPGMPSGIALVVAAAAVAVALALGPVAALGGWPTPSKGWPWWPSSRWPCGHRESWSGPAGCLPERRSSSQRRVLAVPSRV